jgi:hypothetical protein
VGQGPPHDAAAAAGGEQRALQPASRVTAAQEATTSAMQSRKAGRGQARNSGKAPQRAPWLASRRARSAGSAGSSHRRLQKSQLPADLLRLRSCQRRAARRHGDGAQTRNTPGQAFLASAGAEEAAACLDRLVELRTGYSPFQPEAVAFTLWLYNLKKSWDSLISPNLQDTKYINFNYLRQDSP